MIQSLARKGSQRLGRPITAAAASMPGHTALAHYIHPGDRFFRDAFEAINIEYLEIINHSYQGEPLLGPENSILAGHKPGLCQPYDSDKSCVRSGHNQDLPSELYFLVGYYSNELEVIATGDTTLSYVVHTYPFVDYHLGAEERHRNPDERYYWEAFRRFLSMPLAEFRRVPTKLIMYGDHSDEPRMRNMVMEVLESFLAEDQMPEWVEDGVDPVFAGAFGVAEFGLRKPYCVFPEGAVVQDGSSELQAPLIDRSFHEAL